MESIKQETSDKISFDTLVTFFRHLLRDKYGEPDAMHEKPETVLTEYLSPWSKDYVQEQFLKSELFGETICSKLNKHWLKLIGDREVGGTPIRGYELDDKHPESVQLYEQFFEFNPDVVYVKFDTVEKTDNLVVLLRNSLSEDQKTELIQRAELWLPVLYETEKNIKDFFWFNLSTAVESVLAKADPAIERDFIYTGNVIGFVTKDSAEDIFPTIGNPGMVVDGFEKHRCNLISLVNAANVKKFEPLIGQTVRYHFLNINRNYFGAPYGELIAINASARI